MLDENAITLLARHARRLNGHWPDWPALWFFTDAQRTPGADLPGLIAALPSGTGVVFRHYQAQRRWALGRTVAAACRAQGRMLLVAGDAGLARHLGADGVHAPQHLIDSIPGWRQTLKPGRITAAAHDRAAVIRATRAGADAIFAAPVFNTKSHAGTRPLGVLKFAALVHATQRPVFGLGGLTATSGARLSGSGAAGIAAIGALIVEGQDLTTKKGYA